MNNPQEERDQCVCEHQGDAGQIISPCSVCPQNITQDGCPVADWPEGCPMAREASDEH